MTLASDFQSMIPKGETFLPPTGEAPGKNGQPQLCISILNPNLPPDNKCIFEAQIKLEKGKRQFVFGNPDYSLWIQIDEGKKEPIK